MPSQLSPGLIPPSRSLPGVAILVDDARWWWKGRHWAHLVSDESYDELHAFAACLGVPRRAFQGDHYDVPEDFRDHALLLGARAVGSRELARRLRAAGLRLSPSQRRQLPGQVGSGDTLESGEPGVGDEQAGTAEEGAEHR